MLTVSHNPSLLRFPAEAAIIGRMVVGFGEFEIMACKIADLAQPNPNNALKMLYSLRSTSARIECARMLAEPAYWDSSLASPFNITFDAVKECLIIRNQYAHCNWADHKDAGLFFADLQVAAKNIEWIVDWKHIDVPLLERQESIFDDTRRALLFLEASLIHIRNGWPQNHEIPEPLALPPQPKHNPASQHIPPWLSQELKDLHLARAQAAERPATQPERQPSVLKLTVQEWIAKYRKEGKPFPFPNSE